VKRNPCLEAALDELSAVGIRDVIQSHGAKHPQIRWRVNGGVERMYVVTGTPSDVRSVPNTRADIRRALRADGVPVDQPKTITAPAPKLPQRVATLEGHITALRKELAELKKLITEKICERL